MKLWQDKNFGLSIEFPLDSISKSCVCPRGTADWMKTENRSLFQVPFVAGGDAATVTRNDLPERLKGMGYSVNFKADA